MYLANNIVLFGYSGLDPHINECLDFDDNTNKKLTVIEWAGTGKKRKNFWAKKTGFPLKNINIVQKKSILDFTNWDSVLE